MNVVSLTSAAITYSSYISSQGVSSGAEPNTTSTYTIEDILDLSSEAMEQAASSTQSETSSETDGIDRSDIKELWQETVAAKYLQLGYSLQGGENAFFKQFETTIQMSEKNLQTRIDSLLAESGIELDEGERFSIHIDAEGVINVDLPESEGSQRKSEAIAGILNADETLAQDMLRMRATRNSRDSLLGLDVTKSPIGGPTLGQAKVPDLATRKFLAEDYLQREFEISLEDLAVEESGSLQILGQDGSELELKLNEDAAIKEELITVLQNDNPDLEFTADFTFGDGVLLDSQEVSETNINENLRDLFRAAGTTDHPQLSNGANNSLANALIYYNMTAAEEDKISNFSLVLDENGKLSVEGEFVTGEALGITAKEMIESWLNPTFKALAEVTSNAILQKHDAEHGDVDEYKHEVELEVDIITGITAEVRSEEADNAALEDLAETTVDVAESLGTFVHNTFREAHDEMTANEFATIFSDPVDIYIDENGALSIDEATVQNQEYLQTIQEALSVLNNLLEDDKLQEGENSDMDDLPKGLQATFEQLQDVAEIMDRFHDRSLALTRFTFSTAATDSSLQINA